MTIRQLDIWEMNRRGEPRSKVSKRFGFTRQAVYDALKISYEKVETALRHTAEASSIEIIRIDSKNGILLGMSPVDNRKIVITFSKKHGVQTWHFEEPNCDKCQFTKRCTERLKDEAKERDIKISWEQRNLPPSKLAHIIFSKLIPELAT